MMQCGHTGVEPGSEACGLCMIHSCEGYKKYKDKHKLRNRKFKINNKRRNKKIRINNKERGAMSKLVIEIPDDKWFEAGGPVKPAHGEICVIIYATSKTPEIAQYVNRPYRLSKDREPDQGFFIDVGGIWYENAMGCSEINEGYINWGIVERWKPLGLTQEDDERINKITKEILMGDPDEEYIWEDEEEWKKREGIE